MNLQSSRYEGHCVLPTNAVLFGSICSTGWNKTYFWAKGHRIAPWVQFTKHRTSHLFNGRLQRRTEWSNKAFPIIYWNFIPMPDSNGSKVNPHCNILYLCTVGGSPDQGVTTAAGRLHCSSAFDSSLGLRFIIWNDFDTLNGLDRRLKHRPAPGLMRGTTM